MKIALLHYRYAPSIAGVERVMEAHARLLAEAGHEVTVLCGAGESEDARVEVVILPWLLEGGYEPERFAADVECAVEELRPWLAGADCVFVHNVLTMPFHLACTAALWRLAEELPARRLVNWVHDLAAMNPDYPRAASVPGKSGEPWALLRRSHPAMRVVAISDYRAGQFVELTGRPVDAVIPNGVDPLAILNLTPSVARLAREGHLLEAEALLLQPARILRRKNLHLGLHLIAALKARGFQARLLITGARDEHNAASAEVHRELLGLRASLGLEREVLIVSEFFAVTNDDLASLYSLCDVLWFPSREEGFGLPLLEAAIHRLLLFCADSAPMNVMALLNARFFNPLEPPEEIADQFLEFLGENRGFLEARRDVVRRFAWEAIWPRIEAFLRSAPF